MRRTIARIATAAAGMTLVGMPQRARRAIPRPQPQPARCAARLAAAWCVLFAPAHMSWALGGTAGFVALARGSPGRSRCRPIPHLTAAARTDTEGREGSVRDEIRAGGVAGQRWSRWFGGLRIAGEPGGVTVIAGTVASEAALHGLLARVRDPGLPLIFVDRLGPS